MGSWKFKWGVKIEDFKMQDARCKMQDAWLLGHVVLEFNIHYSTFTIPPPAAGGWRLAAGAAKNITHAKAP